MHRVRLHFVLLMRRGARKSVIHFATGAAAVAFTLALIFTGCGDDIENYRPTEEESPYLPMTSPENLMHNLATAYNLRDCARVAELLRKDFVFVFSEHDLHDHGDLVPQRGFWNYPDEVSATCHMFDPKWEPTDSKYKVNDIEMYLSLSGSLIPTQTEGAPDGTLEGHAEMDLQIETGGGAVTILVHTLPLFYFAPDSSQTPTLWALWRCEDGSFLPEALDRVGGARLSDSGAGQQSKPSTGDAALERAEQGTAGTEESSWGIVKAIYL